MLRTITIPTSPMPTAALRMRAALLLCLSAATVARAGAQNFLLKPLSLAEVRSFNGSLDKTVLPDGAGNMRVAGGHAVRVQIAGRTDVTVIPVQFSISEPGLVEGISRDTNQCGLYLIDASGKARFERVAESENAGLIQCCGVTGVGLAHSPDSHAQVLVIFSVHTIHRTWSDPYLVAWSDNEGRYVAEALSAPACAVPTDKLTIAQLRKWIDRPK
jgi:hypothetical protein